MHVWEALLELGGGAVQAPDNLELAERSALQKKTPALRTTLLANVLTKLIKMAGSLGDRAPGTPPTPPPCDQGNGNLTCLLKVR